MQNISNAENMAISLQVIQSIISKIRSPLWNFRQSIMLLALLLMILKTNRLLSKQPLLLPPKSRTLNIGCSTSLLLPDIEHETGVPDFFKYLVPPPTHNFYVPILASYKCISNSLLTFFIRPETISALDPQVFQAISEVKSSSDDFVYLVIVLHCLLPQFGGSPLDLIKYVTSFTSSRRRILRDGF